MHSRPTPRDWLSSVLLAGLLGCQSTPPTRLDRALGVDIDAIFGSFTEETPGAAAMVIRDGVVVHARGYGLADREKKLVFTRETPVRLASVTKQFTCMAILKLAEQGKLSVGDPVRKHLPVLGRFGDGVTIRHLMHHTSGLPDYYAELGRRKDNPPSGDDDPLFTGVDAASLYKTWGTTTSPAGSKYAYSNPGYELLALIIEKASGLTLGEYLDRHVLAPSGMSTAVLRDRPERVIPGRAIGYRRTRGGGFKRHDHHWLNWMVGSGCLYASLDDFYYWDQALEHDRLVSAAAKAAAYTPARLNDGSSTGYGFGWRIAEHLGRRQVSHGGSWVGFRTHISRYPDDHVTIVVLSNLGQFDAGGCGRKIAAIVFAEPKTKDL